MYRSLFSSDELENDFQLSVIGYIAWQKIASAKSRHINVADSSFRKVGAGFPVDVIHQFRAVHLGGVFQVVVMVES